MSTRIIRLEEGQQETLKVYSGKWAEAWTHPVEGEPTPKKVRYLSTPGLMCPSHRDMGNETWEGPGTIAYETRSYM